MVEKRPKTSEQSPPSAHPNGENEQARLDKQDVLAARLRNGDRTAAEELVDAYYHQIYLFMRRLGHDEQTSEDLTQESFLNAWYHIGQLRDGKALKGWLYHIAINVSRLHWRKNKGKEAKKLERIEVAETRESEPDRLGQAEDVERLRCAVMRLPLKLRQVIVLHYLQHLTIAEGAGAAGIRQGTFKSRLNRALKALRKQMTGKTQNQQ